MVTGEGAFDFSSRSGKVPYGVAEVATRTLVPCIALAGQVLVGSREMRALGVESAYSLVDLVGEERALSAPGGRAGRPRRADRAHLVALSAADAGNNRRCATIGPVARTPRSALESP